MGGGHVRARQRACVNLLRSDSPRACVRPRAVRLAPYCTTHANAARCAVVRAAWRAAVAVAVAVAPEQHGPPLLTPTSQAGPVSQPQGCCGPGRKLGGFVGVREGREPPDTATVLPSWAPTQGYRTRIEIER
jgi:hypothetical protein